MPLSTLSSNSTLPVDTPSKEPRVLVVEDEVLLGWSIANALRRVGYEVHLVSSGESAIEWLGSTSYDAVVTDIKLPQINGFKVTEAAKSLARPIPVIVISAIDDEGTRTLLVKTHADGFLEKPFDLKELGTILAKLVYSR